MGQYTVSGRADELHETKKCPYCAEDIKVEAIVCRYCGRDLVAKPVVAQPIKVKESHLLRNSLIALGVVIVLCAIFIFPVTSPQQRYRRDLSPAITKASRAYDDMASLIIELANDDAKFYQSSWQSNVSRTLNLFREAASEMRRVNAPDSVKDMRALVYRIAGDYDALADKLESGIREGNRLKVRESQGYLRDANDATVELARLAKQ